MKKKDRGLSSSQIDELTQRAMRDNKESGLDSDREPCDNQDTISESSEEEILNSFEDEGSKNKKKHKIELFSNFQLCIIGLIVFAVMILFADNSNVIYKYELSERLSKSIRERDSLETEIARDSIIIERIKTDDIFLGKYAREHFYYREDNEEVFIVEPEKKMTEIDSLIINDDGETEQIL